MYAAEAQRIFREHGEVQWCAFKESKIANYYENKKVFVTGATGFLGKLLVEKLLRGCPDLDTIFILVRCKKGEDEYDRVEKLYEQPIFAPLRKLYPKFQHKIRIIKGDISMPGLGISTSDRSVLIEQVNVIFHIAATVRFDEKLTVATKINVRGTRDLLNLAKECNNFEAFVHVSTAYANCVQNEINETFYTTPISAKELISMVETQPEGEIIAQTPKLLGKWPNTYTFTKAIAEDAVRQYANTFPVCIVRPAVVIATYKEPLRSWIDNLYGATGILVGAGTGLLRTIHCDSKKAAEVVPGDYVINNMIAASYKTAIEKNTKNIPIYNYVSSVENRHTWEELMDKCQTWGTQIPSIKCVWYYCLILNKYQTVHMIFTLFLHFLPGLIMDLGLILTKQKPIMTKIYKKINKFESVIAHFATLEWKFYNDNTQALWHYLSHADKKMFPFSMKELDWADYHKTHLLGLRLYLVKDDLSTIPQAQKKWRRFYIAHQIMKTIFGLLLFGLLYQSFSFLWKLY